MNIFRKSKRKSRNGYPTDDNMTAWVGSLAHEIRNPLNTMKINLQLLQEDWSQPDESDRGKALRKLEILGKEVDRLEDILNDFLELARLPQPKMQNDSISLLLDELLNLIEPEAQQLHINVVKDYKDGLSEIEFDADQVKQALWNIILNANQAMPSGGELTIKAYRTDGHIAIDIADTGEGIPSDRISKLFDLFYSTKRDGTGLGLSIARRIINMHGGEIHVKSQEGEGTTFSIRLPCSSK